MKHVHPSPVPPIEELVDERLTRVVEHPDGWYWVAPDGRQQFGPFESLEGVLSDMDIADAGPDTGQTLAETEQIRTPEPGPDEDQMIDDALAEASS